MIRCGDKGSSASARKENYYELLGVSADSNPQQIKDAYRRLQKKYHPDVAGQKVTSLPFFLIATSFPKHFWIIPYFGFDTKHCSEVCVDNQSKLRNYAFMIYWLQCYGCISGSCLHAVA